MGRRLVALVAVTVCLSAPSLARANGDPASDYLLTQNSFLPFTTKIDQTSVKRLNALLAVAKAQKFPIRVAVILSPSDLGTAFSLFGQPEKYVRFLGLELSFVYRGRLLVVMPSGYGFALNGDPDPKASAVLTKLSPPGRDATKEVDAAIVAVQKLAAADGRHLAVPKVSGGSSSRDRLTIAAAATAGIALIAAIVLYRRRDRPGGD
ncbi:MAG TPA: hypothetical protein VK613_02675 [Gaiellaceae bacterium]|nr:hypothetical protein [Gaiellaceae bacterium]